MAAASSQLGADQTSNEQDEKEILKQQWTQLVTNETQARVQHLESLMSRIELQQRVAVQKLDRLMNGVSGPASEHSTSTPQTTTTAIAETQPTTTETATTTETTTKTDITEATTTEKSTTTEKNDAANSVDLSSSESEDLFALPELIRMSQLMDRVPACREQLRNIRATMQQTTQRASAAEATALRLHTRMHERMLTEEGRMHDDRQTDLSLQAVHAPDIPTATARIRSDNSTKTDTTAETDVISSAKSKKLAQPPRIVKRKLKSKVVNLA